MTRDPVARRGEGILDVAGRLDAGTILTTLLVLGLALRVFIAGVYLPLSGFAIDIGDFTAWGQRLASVGPAHFYEAGYFSDYPPGYLYVLWLLGSIGKALGPLIGQDATAGLVKIPGIAADIGVAWLLFVIGRRWAGNLAGRAGIGAETLGIAAATLYLFNPGVVFDSAVWGQIDSVGTLVLLATLYALGRGWTEAAAVGAVAALLIKFQFAFLVPVVAIVGLKRHLAARSSDPALAGRRDPLRVLTSVAAGIGTLAVLMLPFGMTLYAPAPGGNPRGLLGILPAADPSTSLIGKLIEAGGTYVGLSVNAFNLWRNPWSGLGDSLHWGDDTAVVFTIGGAALTWQAVGMLLFAAVAMVALWQVARRDDMRGLLLAALVLAIAFFVLPTRVHERYLFPVLALAAPLIFASRLWPWLYAAVSVSFFANVYWAYTEDWSFAGRLMNPGLGGIAMPQDAFLTSTLLTDGGIWLLAALIVATLGVVVWRSVRLALSPAAADVRALPPATPAPTAVREAEAWRHAPSGIGFGWLARNPADAYLDEPTRRLDRRDALIVLGLVAFALVFRLWRLDIPRAQHFDEVYHARSAAEFLSDWEYGWTRDVYEWTHPMLAKYLIAAGIEAADPNKVMASDPTPTAATALAVAPERESRGFERSIAFTADGGSRITARDAVGGGEVGSWDAGGPIASLAYDPEAPRLLVGRADRGTIEVYELAGLMAAPDGRAPPASTPIETGLDVVSQIVVPDGATDPLLVRGPDGVAVLERADDRVRATAEGAYAGIGFVSPTDDDGGEVAVSDTAARTIVFLDAATLAPVDTLDPIDAPLVGPILVRGNGSDQQLLALTGGLPETVDHPPTEGGVAVIDADGTGASCAGAPCTIGLVPLPGAPTLIGEQRVAGIVYVAGMRASGEAEAWPLEVHMERRGSDSTIGLAAFDATPLPGTPLAMDFDVASTAQGDDHGRLLVATAPGAGGTAPRVVTIDAGSNAFAWRLAGVVSGALLVGLIYLLVATLFGRRRIAVLAAAFVAIDPMSYVMSRISMNDIFVATFIVAAYLLFWQIWSGRWARSAWWALPLTGVLIGLAASTKWVGFYALAGLLVLVLARSDLGRLVLVALVALAAIVGGVGAPWPFLVVMLALLALALAIGWLRPIRVSRSDLVTAIPASVAVLAGVGLAFVLNYTQVEGALTPRSAVEYLFALLARGAQAGWPAFLMIGVAAALIVWRAFVSLRRPRSDARWFQPAEMGGFAWSWVAACLIVIPLVVYALTYVPYLQLGHDWAVHGGPGYGWSLDELHAQMFGYHFNLKAGHASASPWWSWPLALKPTWFFNGSYDSDRIAVIYNGGNPILFWAGIPALAACAVLAWKRRSAALVLVVAAFAFQYVPWIRIERATFAYHYLTAVVFAMIGVAYCVDELLRRPAWRDLAIGYLALVVGVGLLIFPLGSALPMPDWYINAARSLPPWMYSFQFPEPPQGTREELLSLGAAKLAVGMIVAVLAGAFAVGGRDWLARRSMARPASPVPESG